MSLNGLDNLKVKEAHDVAAAEPGGWFLLKYSSRDEVELLGRGNGGIVEIRNTIAQHEEPSPLFGFLRYRRRNVVIKYVPEECSRLVQARVTVHFNAVTERFSPHDTIFPISSSKELRDSTLSAACSLHTASGSTSSSTSSLRRRRLMEIAEDAEEDNRAKRQSTVPEERPPTAKASEISGSQSTPSVSSPQHALPTGLPPSTSYRSMVSERDTSPPPPREPYTPEAGPMSPTKSTDGRRKSSQSTRPDLYTYSSYSSNGKPKIKLGPRPSLDVGGRPHTSAAASHFRPISTLPVGLKIPSKSSKNSSDRPHSQYPQEPPSMTISPPPIPESKSSYATPSRPHTSGGRPTTSSGASIRPLASPNTLTPKLPLMTPEKARLMKALELRKKRENKAAAADHTSPSPSDGLMSLPVASDRPQSSGAPKEVHDTLAMLNDMAKGDDSGIAFDASSTLKTDESDATRSDSYPVSPIGPSEKAESTRASSISESTDETIQETSTSKQPSAIKEESTVEGTRESETNKEPEQVIISARDEEAEHLPRLLPVTYKPPPSVADISGVTLSVTEAPEEAEDESTATLQEKTETPTTQKIVESSSFPHPPAPLAKPLVSHTGELAPVNVEESENITTEDVSIEPKPAAPVGATKEWKVPRSKFSVQDLRAAAAVTEIPDEPLPPAVSEPILVTREKSPIEGTFSIDTKGSLNEDNREHGTSLSHKNKRRGLVEPIRTDIDLTDRSAANSDANLSSDDEFMDELQSAVVQEAMPISVSKSPISPVFPSPKKSNGNRFSRAFSNPLRRENSDSQLLELPDSPQPESSRSVSASAAYLNRINQQAARPIAKKVNLGSGISQRIKALEKLSSNGPAATQPPGIPAVAPGASPAFFSVRKGSVRAASRSPSIAERASSLNRKTPSPSISRESSPETFKIRERSGSIQSRVEAFRASPIPTSQTHKARPESISVTARIVRDPAQPYPSKSEVGKDPLDYKPLDLKQSPLVINHQKAVADAPKETIQERRLSKERLSSDNSKTVTRERRSSITVIKDLISDGRTSFSERRRSMNIEPSAARSPSIKSPSRPPSTHATQRPMSISSRLSISSRDLSSTSPPHTAGSSSSNNDEKAEKKSSRASRMLRRMSSSLTSSRKTVTHAMSPTVREESEPPNFNDSRSLTSSHPSQASMTPTATIVNVGDVNVQFPDSLLWKRRSMALDSQGFLILLPALTASGNGKDKGAGATRRFHFSEFRVPEIPDVEMQELPNSVVLDFIEGGGLQVACEDRAGQGRVLKVLQDAHRTWAAYGQ